MLVKDMFEKNGHNPSCGFAGDIVSYLYDEIDSAEKMKFETHLAGCTNCGAELKAFSGVRASVTDWREADFGWLPSPEIVIPYERLVETAPLVKTRGTVLTDLKRLFSFAPWPPAFAAFGALAIFAGLAFFSVSYLNSPDKNIAANTTSDRPEVSPTVEASPKITTVAREDEAPKQPIPDRVIDPAKNPGPVPVKVSSGPAQPKKNTPTAGDSKNGVKPNVMPASNEKPKAPSLNNYTEEEDTTLRLADLFEEIDTRE